MIENVSERRQMEEAVRASERLRSLMYDAVTDVVFYVGVEPDGGFRFLSVNPAFLKVTGMSEHEVVGQMVRDVVPEPALSMVMANYRRAIAERRTVRWDEASTYPAGTRYGEVSVAPLFDTAGVCTSLVGTVHDVTERRTTQERLLAQAALLDQAKDAIMVRDLDGVIHYWNKGAERLYGWSSAEALDRNVRDLLYDGDDDGRQFERAHAHVRQTGQWSGELAHVTRAGQPVVVEGNWTLLEDGREPRSILCINSDITERKRLETQMIRSQRLESLGTLARGIAHDFNNILVAIVGNVEFARRGLPADHPAQSCLDQVEKAGARARDLVARILTFSREPEAHRQPLALPEVVQEALKLLRGTVSPNIEFQIRFDPEAPKVAADPTQVHQLIMNLGTNALQAMGKDKGLLRVHVQRVFLDARLVTNSASLPRGNTPDSPWPTPGRAWTSRFRSGSSTRSSPPSLPNMAPASACGWCTGSSRATRPASWSTARPAPAPSSRSFSPPPAPSPAPSPPPHRPAEAGPRHALRVGSADLGVRL